MTQILIRHYFFQIVNLKYLIKFEKLKRELETLFSSSAVKLTEEEAKDFLQNETPIRPEQIDKMINHLKSKNMIQPIIPPAQ